jgi:hypothetical protein
MKRALLTILTAVSLLTACSKGGSGAIDAALAKGDQAQALSLLDAAVAAQTQDPRLHALRYLITRQLSLTGPEAGKNEALNKSIAEYEWLAGHYNIPKDYTNSDASLRASAPVQALLDAAGKSVFR